MDAPPVNATLDLHLNCLSWWQPLFYACPPQVVIDGQLQSMRWGQQSLSVSPGSHSVQVYFNYLGKPCGQATIQVEIAGGQSLRLIYKPPFMLPFPGKLKAH